MADSAAPSGEIVLYDQAPLERIGAQDLIERQPGLLAVGTERLYLPTEIVVGNYGVAGALLIDSRPETRWSSYEHDFDRSRDSHYPESLEDAARDAREGYNFSSFEAYGSVLRGIDVHDPEQLAHFVATARGFKMIRTFLIPKVLAEQVKDLGKHIGPALIQQCLAGEGSSGDIPHEERMENWPDWYWDNLLAKGEEPDRSKFGVLFDEKVEALEAALGIDRGDRDFYVSFHGWPWYQKVVDLGRTSLYESITQFDALIASLDRNNTVETRNLGELTSSNTPAVQLPITGADERT